MDMFKDWYLVLNGVDWMELIVKKLLHCIIISTRADARIGKDNRKHKNTKI